MGGNASKEHALLADLIEAARIGSAPHDLASTLLAYFGSLETAMWAPRAAISHAVPGEAVRLSGLFAAAQAVWLHCLREKVTTRPVISNSVAVTDYLRASAAGSPVEEFRVLFLDAGNGLIADHVLSTGTVSQVTVFPREVITRALNVGADGLILVHNHPSGDATPSQSDLAATRRIVAAALCLDIRVHDHVIIGRGATCSLLALGLL
jgi:DNA repair protein RadC